MKLSLLSVGWLTMKEVFITPCKRYVSGVPKKGTDIILNVTNICSVRMIFELHIAFNGITFHTFAFSSWIHHKTAKGEKRVEI